MGFKRTIIINPPSPPGYVSNKDSMGGFGQLYPLGAPPLPPLDMVYLAGYLTDKKVPIYILECLGLGLSKEQLIIKMNALCESEDNGPNLIIVRTSAPTLDWDISVCKGIKESVKNVAIGIYGPVVQHVTWRIKKEFCIDYIVRGEPDETIYELINGRSEPDIQGLSFHNNGGWTENTGRAWNKELDKMPMPKWEMFPYKKYRLPKSSTTSDLPFLPMLTSRGCPFGCNYCPYPVGQGLKWRFRSSQNVVDEIEHLANDLGIRYIIFRDPIFTLNQKRVIEICEEIERRKIYIKWKCETRLDCVNETTLKAMTAAGCEGINFGIESSDIEVQINVGRKPLKKEDVIKTVAMCQKLGIKTFCFFIIGLPDDTFQTILDSIAFAIDLKPDWVQFTAASPFIGTKLREWAISQELIPEDKYAYISSHNVAMGNKNLSKEQVQYLINLAQFIQNYLINRKGILKDNNRTGLVYKSMKSLADLVSYSITHAVFFLGKRRIKKHFA